MKRSPGFIVHLLRDAQGRADLLASLTAEWALVDDDLTPYAALAERVYSDISRVLAELEAAA